MLLKDTKNDTTYFLASFVVEGIGPILGVNPVPLADSSKGELKLVGKKYYPSPDDDHPGVAPLSRKQFENAIRTQQAVVFGVSYLVGSQRSQTGEAVPVGIPTSVKLGIETAAWDTKKIVAHEVSKGGNALAFNLVASAIVNVENSESKIQVPDHARQVEPGRFQVIDD